ncbi:MAG: esterase family protein [Turicibacter sp.]|nr:esterase family protein [Turicibacter sp.]
MAWIQCNFFSTSLMRTVPINVIVPTDKMVFGQEEQQEAKPFKTLYLLHGIFGNYTDWVSGTRIQSWAQDKNIVVVMPSGENRFYVDQDIPGEKYGTFIQKELVEFTRKTFPLSHKKEDTFIGGLSMGGYGAIINGLHAPDVFGAVCALSAATIIGSHDHLEYGAEDIFRSRNYHEMVFGDLDKVVGSNKDYIAVAEQLVKSEQELPKFYVACGTEDFLFDSNVVFKDKLIELGFDVTWVQDTGGHDWPFWDKYIKKTLDWLPLGEEVAGVGSGNVM